MSRSSRLAALALCSALALTLSSCSISWNPSPSTLPRQSPSASWSASPEPSPEGSPSPDVSPSPAAPSARPVSVKAQAWAVYPDTEKIVPGFYLNEPMENPYLVAGLRDKDVEAAINAAIGEKLAAFELKEPPGYPGSATTYREGELLETKYSGSLGFCAGNILSFTITKTLTFRSASAYTDYYYDVLSLNFNLIDGEELTLEDVFPAGTDPMREINAALSAMYARRLEQELEYDDSNPLDFYGPFSGLERLPDFYISETGVYLLFPPEAGRVYSPWNPSYPATLHMSLPQAGGRNALWSDIDPRADIYEDEPGRYLLFDNILKTVDYYGAVDRYIDAQINGYALEDWTEAKYAGAIGEFISVPDRDSLVSELRARAKREKLFIEYNLYAGGRKCGRFYMVTRTEYCFFYGENVVRNENVTDTLVIDTRTGAAGGMELLFRDGWDYRAAFAELMLSSTDVAELSEDDRAALRGHSGEISAEFAPAGLYLSLRLDSGDFSQALKDELSAIWVEVKYRDIGYDNIKLFE